MSTTDLALEVCFSTRFHIKMGQKLKESSIVTGYPPNIPSRDPNTWCRIMQHVQVLMISDAPEFFTAILELDRSIRAEVFQGGDMTDQRAAEIEKVRSEWTEKQKSDPEERMSNLLAARASMCVANDKIPG